MRKPAALIALLAVALVLGGCQAAFPPSAVTEEGVLIENLYLLVFVMAAVVFVLVEGLIIWSVIKYRRKPSDASLPAQTHGNLVLEVIWTVIPLVAVVGLFFASSQVLGVVDARKPEEVSVKVEVVGYQWQWKFGYPAEGIEIYGTAQNYPELVVPIDERIEVTLVAQDVNHGFYIPEFLFQRDLVPGKVNYFEFTPNKLGTFAGQCSAFCGLLHHAMGFTVRVVTREEYDAWLVEMTPEPAPSESPVAVEADLTAEVKEWSVSLSGVSTAAGDVTFGLTNAGNIPHEFIVVRSELSGEELLGQVDAATSRLDEAALDAIGEQPEFSPGETKTLTLSLEPGKYVVLCNIAGHFSSGMYADLEITAN
jgi:cytochrome c oxidase subunit 2